MKFVSFEPSEATQHDCEIAIRGRQMRFLVTTSALAFDILLLQKITNKL